MSRKIMFLMLAVSLALLVAMPAQQAFAADVTITVTLGCTLGVSVSSTSWALGTMSPGQYIGNNSAGTGGGPIVVTNTGSGCAETYELSCTASSPDGWTPANAASNYLPGANIFGLYAGFNGDEPTNAEIQGLFASASQGPMTVTLVPRACDNINFSGPDGDQFGANVPTGQTRNLWLYFGTPTSTSATAAQTIALTLTAQQT
jgi:hypothetical protein